MHIYESLSFLYHATMVAAKGNRALSSLNFLRHRSRGISVHVAHHLAMTAILSTMLWASPAWWTGTLMITATLHTTYNSVA